MSDQTAPGNSKPCIEHAAMRVRIGNLQRSVDDLYECLDSVRSCCEQARELKHQQDLMKQDVAHQFEKTCDSIQQAMEANKSLYEKVELQAGKLDDFMHNFNQATSTIGTLARTFKIVVIATIPALAACTTMLAFMTQAVIEKAFIRDSAALQEVIDARIVNAKLEGVKASKNIDKQDASLSGVISGNN